MEFIDGKITGFATGREVCQIFEVSKVWQNYAKSMAKRRVDSALPHNSFGRYVRRVSAFLHGNSMVIGKFTDGNFFVSHFCPNTSREGRDLLLALRNVEERVVIAVTEDLASMIAKLGYQFVGRTFQPFRGERVEKFVFINK